MKQLKTKVALLFLALLVVVLAIFPFIAKAQAPPIDTTLRCYHYEMLDELAAIDSVAPFNLSPCFWKQDTVYYWIKNAPANVSADDFVAAICAAAEIWNEHGVPYLYETKNYDNKDFIIETDTVWHYNEDKTRYPDGVSNVLAWCYYPCGGFTPKMRFDIYEAWTPDFVKKVALHEWGHGIGVAHSDMYEAVMYPYYKSQEHLDIDDIEAKCAHYKCAMPPKVCCFSSCDVEKKNGSDYTRTYCERNGIVAKCATEVGTCIDIRTDIDDAVECLRAEYPKLQVNIIRGYDCCGGKYDYHAALPLGAVDVSFTASVSAGRRGGVNVPVSPLFLAGLAKQDKLWGKLVDDYGIRAIKIRRRYVHLDTYERKNPNRVSENGQPYFFDFSLYTNIE